MEGGNKYLHLKIDLDAANQILKKTIINKQT
jgi:hypothetical protein